MRRTLKRLAAACCALIIAITVAATPAAAVSWYCQDEVQPVTLLMTWNSTYNSVYARTSAPINSTAKLYWKPAGATTWSYVGYAHDPAGTQVTIILITTTPANYVILNYPDAGQSWYAASGATLSYCRSPIRTLI